MDESSFEINIIRGVSALTQVELEPAGQWFHQYEYSRIHGSSHEINSTENSSDESKDREHKNFAIEDDITFLRSLDPVKWKDQDHYRVLGLHNHRFEVTDEDVKRAHRHMVLRHHPDKRRGGGEEVREDDDYFTNIIKAYETLGDPIKRRSYDSVDPMFDDTIPEDKPSNKAKFFSVFGDAFERNSRWSVQKRVPQLGTPEDSKEKIEHFYDFWYNFDSWREFSYLDEEDKEKGEDRDERRWIDKQNKAERAAKKKEESARIRKLVDTAYKLDPRIAKYKAEEKEKKMALKKAKQEAIRLKIEEEQKERQRIEEEERVRKEKEEEELKVRLAQEKKERERMKKELRNERKIMRGLCKEADYFITDEKDRVQAMMDVETLCDGLQLLQLKDLVSRVEDAKDDKVNARKVIKQEIEDLRSGKLENINITNNLGGGVRAGPSQNGVTKPKPVSSPAPTASLEWSPEELQLLIKAVNLFPAGTAKRWDVVAQYLSQHGPNKVTRPSKEVLGKAKDLQNNDSSQLMREAANKTAVASLAGDNTTVTAPASERLETPQEMLGMNLAPWSSEEQSLLEQALKTYPASTQERWEKISQCIPGRSKKDCMRRYKELAEMIKAKKAALKAAGVQK